jgi:hypothetical protein
METLWTDPQYRTEGERTDAIVKRLASRIASLRQAREDYGYTATEIERLEADDRDEATRQTADPFSLLDPSTRALVKANGAAGPPASA